MIGNGSLLPICSLFNSSLKPSSNPIQWKKIKKITWSFWDVKIETSHQEMIHLLHYLFLDMCRILLYVTMTQWFYTTFWKNVDQQCLIIVFTTANIKFIMFATTKAMRYQVRSDRTLVKWSFSAVNGPFWHCRQREHRKRIFKLKYFIFKGFFYVFMLKNFFFFSFQCMLAAALKSCWT